jgi:hypothetical protein
VPHLAYADGGGVHWPHLARHRVGHLLLVVGKAHQPPTKAKAHAGWPLQPGGGLLQRLHVTCSTTRSLCNSVTMRCTTKTAVQRGWGCFSGFTSPAAPRDSRKRYRSAMHGPIRRLTGCNYTVPAGPPSPYTITAQRAANSYEQDRVEAERTAQYSATVLLLPSSLKAPHEYTRTYCRRDADLLNVDNKYGYSRERWQSAQRARAQLCPAGQARAYTHLLQT